MFILPSVLDIMRLVKKMMNDPNIKKIIINIYLN